MHVSHTQDYSFLRNITAVSYTHLDVYKRQRKKRAVKATEQLYKRAYKKYPNLVRTIMTRNAVYNKQMKLIEKLEEEGKIFVIRPLIPTVSRMEKDYDKLQHFYMHGNRLMKKEYQGLLEYLNE